MSHGPFNGLGSLESYTSFKRSENPAKLNGLHKLVVEGERADF